MHGSTTIVNILRRSCICALSLALGICCAGTPAYAKVVERIVAVVNGDIITQTELDQRIASETTRRTTSTDAILEQNRADALNDLIDEVMLKQAIDKSSDVDVSDEELQRAVSNILMQNGMTNEQLRNEVARKGMTYDEYLAQVKGEIKKIKFINRVIGSEIKVTDRDLRDYFDKHKASFLGGTQAHIAEIVLPIAGIRTQQEAVALRDRAIAISRESRDNGAAFTRLARQHSQGPNADQGGDLGVVKIGDLPQRVAAAVRNMPEGAVSDPIPTDNALVIVKLIEWPQIADDDFNRVRDEIYQRLHDQRIEEALDAYMQRMKQHAYIEIR